jgi:hypothetical protein
MSNDNQQSVLILGGGPNRSEKDTSAYSETIFHLKEKEKC